MTQAHPVKTCVVVCGSDGQGLDSSHVSLQAPRCGSRLRLLPPCGPKGYSSSRSCGSLVQVQVEREGGSGRLSWEGEEATFQAAHSKTLLGPHGSYAHPDPVTGGEWAWSCVPTLEPMVTSIPHKHNGLLGEVCTAEIKLGTLPRKGGWLLGRHLRATAAHQTLPLVVSQRAASASHTGVGENRRGTPFFPIPASGRDSLSPQLLNGEVWGGRVLGPRFRGSPPTRPPELWPHWPLSLPLSHQPLPASRPSQRLCSCQEHSPYHTPPSHPAPPYLRGGWE